MTIRRGITWGETVRSPDGLQLVATDAEAGAMIRDCRERGGQIPPLGLVGGDLARTLGGGAPGRFPGKVMRAPVDVLRVEAAGETTWAVAHVVARRRWWRGELLLAMNAQFLGAYDVAPRSHPNDGRVDLLHVDARMGLRTRLDARLRARTGIHLPHPLIGARQAATGTVAFARPLTLWVDGERWVTADAVTITVEPDAFIAHA